MKLYIVRHGKTLHNDFKQYSNEDIDLNDFGIEQSNKLKMIIKEIDFDIIISSPLLRAKHTADIINSKNIKIVTDDRLIERDPKDLSGKPFSFTNRDEYWNYHTKIQYGSSENMKLFFNRVYSFIEDLKLKNYNSVLIVAHSGVSKAFSSYFEGIQDGKFLNRGLKNCEIKEYIL